MLAAKDIGKGSRRIGLPLIAGCIFTGILGGPYALNIVSEESISALQFINFIALAFIAFAAGSKLHMEELRGHLKGIVIILTACALAVIICGTVTMLIAAPLVPFMSAMSSSEKFAISILAATVLIAISPSTLFDIIKELRAKGRFTRIALGVTLLMEVVVIFVFAVSSAIADLIFEGIPFNIIAPFMLIFELAMNILFGYATGHVFRLVLSLKANWRLKGALILLAGHIVFSFSEFLRGVEMAGFPMPVFSEPLLICLVAGLYIANGTRYKKEVEKIVESFAPGVFLLFFTLLGAEMDLGVLRSTWFILLALVLVRILAMSIGGFGGALFSKSIKGNKHLLGMAFVAQAGVSLSLAKEIGINFPGWGDELATIIVAVIVINTLIGPPFLKFVISRAGEAHLKGKQSVFAMEHLACIFGVESQSLQLARQLQAHNWAVKIIDTDESRIERLKQEETDLDSAVLKEISAEDLRALGIEQASAIIVMLDKQTNYNICKIAHEHFAAKDLIVRVHDPANIPIFRELGAFVVDPGFAIVNLLANFVRSPSATSLLLGREEDKDVLEISVTNPTLHGMYLRDIHLPSDTLVLSIRRRGSLVLSHGYTRLRRNDEVTVIGSLDSLKEVQLRFEA